MIIPIDFASVAIGQIVQTEILCETVNFLKVGERNHVNCVNLSSGYPGYMQPTTKVKVIGVLAIKK
jgi:hypothetical protein